jgi:hypothetical protein
MNGRFGAAVSRAQAGDVDGFAHSLKQAGYYTAPEAEYATALRGIVGHGGGRPSSAGQVDNILPVPTSLSTSHAGGYATSDQLGRVLDALSLSAVQIAAPSDDSAARITSPFLDDER